MKSTRFVVDGLWRCLCPSVDAAALFKAINVPLGAQSQHRPRSQCLSRSLDGTPEACSSHWRLGGARHIHQGADARVGRLDFRPTREEADNSSTFENVSSKSSGSNGSSGGGGGSARIWYDANTLFLDQLPWERSLLKARPPYRRELDAAPTQAIIAALRRLQDMPTGFDKVYAFVRYLLKERQMAPTAMLYEALLRANCHTKGSADCVRHVLRALKETEVEGTSGLYHGALAVLAVHPDYMLRNEVLQEMKQRWIELTPQGMQSLALGLLRDGQYERALDQLEAIAEGASSDGMPAPAPWVFDVFIYVLGQRGFLDDTLKIVNHRLLREGDALSLNIWYFLLDLCCQHSHYAGLRFVWQRAVRPGLLSMSDAMGLAVLNTAAQHHDSALAAEAMQMLAQRGTKLSMAHFEAIVDSYAGAGLIHKALQALCIMNDAGIVPDQGSTRSIYLHLTRAEPNQLQQQQQRQKQPGFGQWTTTTKKLDMAVTALFELRAKYGSVPIGGFNVVLEAMLEQLQQRQQQRQQHQQQNQPYRRLQLPAESIEPALDLYRHVRQLCPSGPSRNTFRLLFRKCRDTQHLNFLFHEMRAFSFQPDMEMIDLLVYENARTGSLDVALGHVFTLMGDDAGEATPETLRSRPWISRKTAAELVKRCVQEEDERIWEVAEASRMRGRPLDALLQEAVRDRPRRAQNAYGVPHSIDLDRHDSPSEATLTG